jgi:hypothetical protein
MEAKRVSSMPSPLPGPGNLVPFRAETAVTADTLRLNLSAVGASRFRYGGDYLEMTADVEGTFHPVWADARSGSYQLWTSRIAVLRTYAAAVVERKTRSVLHEMSLVLDPVHVSGNELEIPVRLRNVSAVTVYPPIRVILKRVSSRRLRAFFRISDEFCAVSVLNPKKDERTGEIIEDYTDALGDLKSLEPGTVTEAVLWRVRVDSYASGSCEAPSFDLDVLAGVAAK